MSPTLLTTQVTAPSVQERTSKFTFYGASRFEAPSIGMTFRREREIYQIVTVTPEFNRDGDFSRKWKFIADCRTVSL
jgi:hypothetical protein